MAEEKIQEKETTTIKQAEIVSSQNRRKNNVHQRSNSYNTFNEHTQFYDVEELIKCNKFHCSAIVK